MSGNPGVFTISLDTELAWGTFDVDRVDQHVPAYERTQTVVERLCSLFETYEIPATWAVVTHLLEDCQGSQVHADRTQPDFDWIDDWFGELPCETGLDRSLWHAPWLLDRLRSCSSEQDIGLHGSTHLPLGAPGCARRNASEELAAAVETLETHGISPTSFVFPRNAIGHLDVLDEHGIEVYRGVDARWYEQRRLPGSLRPPLRFVDELTRQSPRAVTPTVSDGLVNVPGSQVFRPRNGGWQYTPASNSVVRAKKGLQRAADTGRVFHLWFHPFNLAHRPATDLERFERVLERADELVASGDLECLSMHSVAQQAREGRWN